MFLALVPGDPLLPGPTGVAAAQPGEARVKRQCFTEMRGLPVCQWPVLLSHGLWCTLLSLGSTVTAVPGIRTPLGSPRQQPQLSGQGFPGGQVLTPVSTLEDSSVCHSMWQPPPVPSPEVRACVGSRSGQPGFESHASHFWLLDLGCDAQTLRTSILRSSPAQGSRQWRLPRGPGQVPGRPGLGERAPQTGATTTIPSFHSPAFPCCEEPVIS